jgi:hypothetical protein
MVNASYSDYTSRSFWTIHIYSVECETILATTLPRRKKRMALLGNGNEVIAMKARLTDMAPVVNLTRGKGTGPVRFQRPIYTDLLPPLQ